MEHNHGIMAELDEKFPTHDMEQMEHNHGIMAELDEKFPTLMCSLGGLLSQQRTNVYIYICSSEVIFRSLWLYSNVTK